MKNPVFILLAMIFCHVIDDYRLQGILASLKQKKYWEENAPQKLYKHDYIMALIMHSFSWSFMIMLPIFFIIEFTPINVIALVSFFCINLVFHAITDDQKANRFSLNLIQDQIIHLVQIIGTWLFFMMYLGMF